MRLPRRLLLSVSLLMATSLIRPQQALPVSVEATATERKGPSKVMVEFEGFTVDVTLSDKAKRKLLDGKETIIVAAYFTGRPKPDIDKKYISDMGEIGLGEAQLETTPGQSARFDKAKLSQDALNQSLNKNPILLINVYSGRKSSKNNLLDCGIYEDDLKPVQGKSIPIACKLIGEQ
jgi:hypothetical protein